MQGLPTQRLRLGLPALFLLAFLPSCATSQQAAPTQIQPPTAMMLERQGPGCNPKTNNDLLICINQMQEVIDAQNVDKRGLIEWAESLEDNQE